LKPNLLDLSPPELVALVSEWGEPAYRVKQVSAWIYRRLAGSFEEMTDLPAPLRRRLATDTVIRRLRVEQDLLSSDGFTRKWLFRLPDGVAIETVRMRYDRRRTVCVSTQAGCAMGCVFCATGRLGLERHLTTGEIVEQVLHAARSGAADGARPTNVVLMGMGEPFANYDPTMKAVRTLIDPDAFGMGARRITVSTVGVVPGIGRFAREGLQVNLAVSLHAATDALRDRLVPANRRWPLDPLFRAVRDYVDRTRRRVSFEWALIRGVNDSVEQARALGRRAQGLLCHVNLIPMNSTDGIPFEGARWRDVERFRLELERARVPVTVRVRRGLDIRAGCGQLRADAAARETTR
jgi:23S rRNA (adenine2503-C2)-methyltransferase